VGGGGGIVREVGLFGSWEEEAVGESEGWRGRRLEGIGLLVVECVGRKKGMGVGGGAGMEEGSKARPQV